MEKGFQARANTGVGCWSGGGDGQDVSVTVVPRTHSGKREETALISDFGSILNGFDNEGRPILYLRPGRENQKTSPRQIRHLIFHL